MKKHYLSIFTVFVILCSCSTPEENMIKEYFSQNEAYADLKIVSHEFVEPITQKDSFQIYKDSFEQHKAYKTEHLLKAREGYNEAIRISKEGLETTGFKVMKELFQIEIDKAEAGLASIDKTLTAYDGDCKGTSLENEYLRLKQFENMPDTIYYQVLKISVKDNKGENVSEMKMLTDAEKTKILKVMD